MLKTKSQTKKTTVIVSYLKKFKVCTKKEILYSRFLNKFSPEEARKKLAKRREKDELVFY